MTKLVINGIYPYPYNTNEIIVAIYYGNQSHAQDHRGNQVGLEPIVFKEHLENHVLPMIKEKLNAKKYTISVDIEQGSAPYFLLSPVKGQVIDQTALAKEMQTIIDKINQETALKNAKFLKDYNHLAKPASEFVKNEAKSSTAVVSQYNLRPRK